MFAPHARNRGVQFLLGGGVILYQWSDAVEILLRLQLIGLGHGQVGLGLCDGDLLTRELQVRFALREVAFRLFQRCFVGANVQYVQRVSRVNLLAGSKKPLIDISVHASANFHSVSGVRLRGILGENRNVARAYSRHHHWLRKRRATGRTLCGRLTAPACETG